MNGSIKIFDKLMKKSSNYLLSLKCYALQFKLFQVILNRTFGKYGCKKWVASLLLQVLGEIPEENLQFV